MTKNTQTRSPGIVHILVVSLVIVGVLGWLTMNLVHSTQCSSAQYLWSHPFPPPAHVVTSIDGQIASDRFETVPVAASAMQQLKDRAGADWQAAGCKGDISTTHPGDW